MLKRVLITGAAIWVCGFIAALVLVARWRHIGGRQSTESAESIAAVSPDASGVVQTTSQRLTVPIVAGAKHDLHTLRDVTRKVTHRHEPTVEEVAASVTN